MGLSLSIGPRDETSAATMDDNDIRCDVDGCLWNRARSAFQDRLRVFRAALLVHIPPRQELLEQSHLSVRYRGHPVMGNAGEQVLVSCVINFLVVYSLF